MRETISQIYGDEPAWMHAYENAPAMQRLKNVCMNCGLNYTSLPLYQNIPLYTRYRHSVNTALAAWHFTDNKVQSLACLFHDIATPAFSHTIDFLYGDHLKQERTEDHTAEIIHDDPVISRLLMKEGIPEAATSDYHQYPLADNDAPRLSCDRLEYTLSNSFYYGFADIDTLKNCYKDIINDQNELVFQSLEQAHVLGVLSIQCGRVYASHEDRFGMEMLALIIHKAIENNILNERDLYTDEANVISILQSSALKSEWDRFVRLHGVRTCETGGKNRLKVVSKKRYIDPYVKGRGRLHALDQSYMEMLQDYLDESQNVWLEGEFQ